MFFRAVRPPVVSLLSPSLHPSSRRECPAYSGIGHLVNLFEAKVPEKTPFEMPAERKKRVRNFSNMHIKCYRLMS